MKKFHWGHAILVFFIFYIGTLAFVLYKSTTVDHSLVVQDYYNQDLNYQLKYDKIKNVQSYKKTVIIQWMDKERKLTLDFKEAKSRTGSIKLYNPANKSKDISVNIDNAIYEIYEYTDLGLSLGRWKVQVDWLEDGIPFYVEDELYIAQP